MLYKGCPGLQTSANRSISTTYITTIECCSAPAYAIAVDRDDAGAIAGMLFALWKRARGRRSVTGCVRVVVTCRLVHTPDTRGAVAVGWLLVVHARNAACVAAAAALV